ncbi:hypothetical protein Q2464_24670, partial [Escherichia coli]|nr:hypothetical protein [Escherichia coli]
VMEVEDLVEAALDGFDRREAVTIPSLPDAADWQVLMTARARLAPNLSRQRPAERYLGCGPSAPSAPAASCASLPVSGATAPHP